MQVKERERQQGHASPPPRKAREHRGDQQSPERAVQPSRMILPIVEEAFALAEGLIAEVHRQAETIGIRQDAGQRHEPAVARIVGRLRSNLPTRQQVRER